jgi:hypothetical protein
MNEYDDYPPQRYPVTRQQKLRRRDQNRVAIAIILVVMLVTPIGTWLIYGFNGP